MASPATDIVETMRSMEKDELLELYRQMCLIRRFEERAAEQYAYGKIGGFLHLYIGGWPSRPAPSSSSPSWPARCWEIPCVTRSTHVQGSGVMRGW